jgi:signal transduction histidine kinase/ligand-binding sensor domain-containing protein
VVLQRHPFVANETKSPVARAFLFLAVFLLASAGWVAALDPGHRISQYGHSSWKIQDGYFGSQPVSITQTTDGYLWVETEGGIFRFDGVQFVSWTSLTGEKLPSNDYWPMLGAKDGSLYIGTDSGLLRWANQRSIRYLDGETIGGIIQDEKGQIWFTHYRPDNYPDPLCRISGTDVRCYGYGSVERGLLSAPGPLAEDGLGSFWVGHNTAVVRWTAGSAKIYRLTYQGSIGVTDLAVADDGSVWLGIETPGRGGGLQHLVGGVMQPFAVPKLNGETLRVCALLIDRQGSLWVGTLNQGLYRIHGTDVDHFGSVNGLSSDSVNHLFEDREGSLWVATSKGLDILRDLPVSTFSTSEGVSEDEVESVLAARDGTVWIGSNHLQALGPNGLSPELGKGLPGNYVTSLLEDHTGRLWVGMDRALWIHEGGKNNGMFRQIRKADGSAIGMVWGLTEDSEHNIWVEAYKSLIRIRDLTVREEFPQPPVPLANKLAPDPQSGIWLGLLSGDLARFRSGKTEIFTFPNHPNTKVKALFAASDGSILGATEFGVVAWKSGKQQILSARNGLPCDDVNTLNSDDQSDLWLYSACGLIEVPREEIQRWWREPEAKLKTRIFDALDGVQAGLSHFSGSSKAPDGRLWFANNSVAQTMDPAHLTGNTVPPPVHITGIVADRKSYPLLDALKLPALTRDLEIDYTAPSLSVPKKVLFRYMLEGHDAGWQEPGTRRQAFYNDLPPRHYRFRVIACNNDGVWNETGASLDFSILPAYYQTAWFRASYVAAFLLLLWSIYRMRVRQVARAMSNRFDERLAERTRIARDFHDTYLQTIQGSKLVADSALKQSPDFARMRGALEQLSVWLGRATEEGRAALSSLRTSTTEKNDLAAAFQRAIEECRINSSIEASFTVAGEASEMHPIVRDEVYRIGYEAIRNACVHSQATDLRVELAYADDLILRVRDNGVGITPAVVDQGKQEHFGLRGMRERARGIMAKFTLNTSPVSGSEITLVVPGSIIYRTTNSRGRKWPAIESLLKRMGLRSNSADS